MIEEETKLNKKASVGEDIVNELKKSYINYAMSVIVSRALPDVRDGLKPVQRRILYTMHRMNIGPSSQYKKVARIVGEVMGKYHPHGDASISDALVRMGQDFNMRYTLIDGQGNYGSIDGDPPAAMRYIEARLDKYGAKMLEELDKKTVDFIPNYDGNEEEPVVLPTVLPTLLLNGSEGIAVGMATKIPPHNLTEVMNALIKMIEAGNEWDFVDIEKVDYSNAVKTVSDIENLPKNRFHKFETSLSVSEIMSEIKGPDFPTGGTIYDQKEIMKVYETGKGRVVMRGTSKIEEHKNGRMRIIITDLPYQVNKANLIAKIAMLYKDKKIDGISDLRDESNSREGIRIVIELKREAKPKTVQNQLYKFTELQKTFNANMLALVDGDPKLLNIKQILQLFISHRQEIVIRRNEFELGKLREREHILEGLMIALDNIDEIIQTIRSSKDAETAKLALITKFKLTEIQAQAILDMQLRKLAALERQKIEEEYKQVLKSIKETLELLSSPDKILNVIKNEFEEIKNKFGDERKTKFVKGGVGEISEEDLIPNEETIVTISKNGYIKRVKHDALSAQKRGGVGKKAMTTKENDEVRHVFTCSTHDEILFFSNKGKVYSLKVHEIPEYSRTAKGIPVINLINIEQDELITSILTRSKEGGIIDEDISQEGETLSEKQGIEYKYLIMATKFGVVKKTELSHFDNIRSNGLIAISLDDNDELVWVKPSTGNDHVIIVTRNAKSIHFRETDVRETGRTARGVRGIRLKKDDEVISMDIVRKNEDFMLTVSEKGFGKLTTLNNYTIQNRGGSGIFAAKINNKTGKLVVARILDHPHKELLILSAKGQAVRIATDDLPIQGRQTSGVRLMRVKDDDVVATVAIV
ncbi:MAG: DNA gyrase subunit A [Candidatus Dojkabacteria bacterium]|nr:MAG: DNA gyrase subunit A [Candidatus Dojkabacteria bacterium]